MYDAAAWHDYFMMVGGGAAALTGLVFVAMSLHLDQIALNAAHRHRARTVLTGLTAVFIRCALVLMAKQSGQAVALELIVVLIAVEFVLYRSIRQALAATDASDPALLWRTIGSFSCLAYCSDGPDPSIPGASQKPRSDRSSRPDPHRAEPPRG